MSRSKDRRVVNFFDQKLVDWWWENGNESRSIRAKFVKTDVGGNDGPEKTS